MEECKPLLLGVNWRLAQAEWEGGAAPVPQPAVLDMLEGAYTRSQFSST